MNPERKSIYERKSMLPPRTPLSRHFHAPTNTGLRGGRLADEARASMAAGFSINSRPSGIPGCKGRHITAVPKTQTITDQRNLRDRDVQAGIVAKVVQFLEDRVEPAPPFNFGEPNFLRYASKNDFKNVFEYLFQCIEPTFQVQKIEKDALNILTQLGYPYALKHSTMQTMTLPASWGQLLGALDWMIDIVEMENDMYQNTNKIREDPQWELLTSCFKKRVTKGPAQPFDRETFKDEFEVYRRQKMAEKGIDCNSHDELVARRVAQEQKIHKLEDAIAEAQRASEELEKKITDCEKDMISLDKYIEDVQLVASNKERALNDLIQSSNELELQMHNLVIENQEKERQISAQKLSGEAARALITKRQSVREELVVLRESLIKTDSRIYELQPNFFKQSAKIRSDYNLFMSRLRVICEPFFYSEELQQQLAELERCSFDQAIVEFQRSRNDNKLSRLLTHLKGLTESQSLTMREAEETTRLSKSRLVNEINDLMSTKDQLQSKRNLELERAKREFADKQRPLVDAKHGLDMVQQKHKATADQLNKYEKQLAVLHDEFADKHKRYVDYRDRLDTLYVELQSQVLEKVAKLCDHFQKIMDQKRLFKELANEIIEKNAKALEKFKATENADCESD